MIKAFCIAFMVVALAMTPPPGLADSDVDPVKTVGEGHPLHGTVRIEVDGLEPILPIWDQAFTKDRVQAVLLSALKDRGMAGDRNASLRLVALAMFMDSATDKQPATVTMNYRVWNAVGQVIVNQTIEQPAPAPIDPKTDSDDAAKARALEANVNAFVDWLILDADKLAWKFRGEEPPAD